MNKFFAVKSIDNKWACFDHESECPYFSPNFGETNFFSNLKETQNFCNTWELDWGKYEIVEFAVSVARTHSTDVDPIQHD
jgi:hypothetical protein